MTQQVPPAPAYAQPVSVPEPRAGEACLVVAGRERAGRLTANRMIDALKGDWNAMSESYAGKK